MFALDTDCWPVFKSPVRTVFPGRSAAAVAAESLHGNLVGGLVASSSPTLDFYKGAFA